MTTIPTITITEDHNTCTHVLFVSARSIGPCSGRVRADGARHVEVYTDRCSAKEEVQERQKRL